MDKEARHTFIRNVIAVYGSIALGYFAGRTFTKCVISMDKKLFFGK